ncbi:outer membrane homotrimeric porin [Humidesulfovibrio idahonensis]
MKKLALTLVLMAALVVGATTANAATIKATGQWQVDATWTTDQDMRSDTKNDDFAVLQRMRTAFQFIANENLKGVLETQIGTNNWGNGLYSVGAGRSPNTTAGVTASSLGSGQGNLLLRKGYLDFKWPGTKVNFLVGYQSLALPSAFGAGSAILDDHVAGAAAVVPVMDNLSLVGGYVRPIDLNQYGTTATKNGNGTFADASFLFANVDFTGVSVKPFFAYAYAGKQTSTSLPGMLTPNIASTEGARGYWGGAALTVTALDPFKIMADVNYGKATYNAVSDKAGRSGWLADLAVDYTGLSMMTPEVFFAYTSGEDGTGTKSERMPTLSAENFAYGTFWMQGGDSLKNSYSDPSTNMGFWAVGASLKDIKLIDKLSHTLNVIYFKGTNNKDIIANGINNGSVVYGRTLSNKDSLWEVDLNSKYQIYEELSLGLELGYINADFDKDVWANALGAKSGDLSKDAYKVNFMLNYSF